MSLPDSRKAEVTWRPRPPIVFTVTRYVRGASPKVTYMRCEFPEKLDKTTERRRPSPKIIINKEMMARVKKILARPPPEIILGKELARIKRLLTLRPRLPKNWRDHHCLRKR